VAGTFWS